MKACKSVSILVIIKACKSVSILVIMKACKSVSSATGIKRTVHVVNTYCKL